MHCVTLLGQRLMAKAFDRQVAEIQVRIAVLNRYTALGIPVTEAVGWLCSGKGNLGHHKLCASKPRSMTEWVTRLNVARDIGASASHLDGSK